MVVRAPCVPLSDHPGFDDGFSLRVRSVAVEPDHSNGPDSNTQKEYISIYAVDGRGPLSRPLDGGAHQMDACRLVPKVAPPTRQESTLCKTARVPSRDHMLEIVSNLILLPILHFFPSGATWHLCGPTLEAS
ncbi:hypothetical protein AAC387_Pa02g4935 [Persea americana]